MQGGIGRTGMKSVKKLHLIKKRWITEKRLTKLLTYYPAKICLFKVKNRNTRKRCEIYSKLTTKHENDDNDVALVSLLTLSVFHTFF